MSLSSIGSSVLSHTFFFKNKTNLFHLKLEGAYMSGWVGEELWLKVIFCLQVVGPITSKFKSGKAYEQ